MKSSVISMIAIAAFASADYNVATTSTYAPATTSSAAGYAAKPESSSVYHAASSSTTCTEEGAHSTSTPVGYPVKSSSSAAYPVYSSSSAAYPVYSSSAAVPYPVYSTKTVVESVTYTVSKCAATVTNCPYGSQTSGVVTKTYTYPVASTTPAGYPAGSGTPSGPAVTYPAGSYPVGSSSAAGPAVYPTGSAPAAPVYSTVTISTCVPSYITKVITVTPSAPAATYPAGVPTYPAGGNTIVTKPYGTGAPGGYASGTTGSPAKPTATGYQIANGASATQAGGLLMVVGLVAALL